MNIEKFYLTFTNPFFGNVIFLLIKEKALLSIQLFHPVVPIFFYLHQLRIPKNEHYKDATQEHGKDA